MTRMDTSSQGAPHFHSVTGWKGLIQRREHSNTYVLTADGQRVAIFYTKVHDRVLRPLIGTNTVPAPAPLRQALKTIEEHIDSYLNDAHMANAA